jgi:pyruvyltransferase
MKNFIVLFFIVLQSIASQVHSYKLEGLPLYYWQKGGNQNFGDYLSLKLVERIVGGQVISVSNKDCTTQHKLLAIGSVLITGIDGDVVWGTGMNAKRTDLGLYKFDYLDVRAIRGPLTRKFLMDNFNIYCPETYGDPALLIPYLFPEFKKKKDPQYDYIIIPHYSEEWMFPKDLYPNVVYPTEPWNEVIRKILNSKFVISSSLHGLIIADAYDIPSRYLRVTDHEPLFKYEDYYLGTNRPAFAYATSIEEALDMGGEPPFECDLEKLYYSFPFEYWPHAHFKHPTFK